MKKPLRAIIFDVGNVLYGWDPRFLYQKLITDADRLDWFLRHVITHEWHFQHDAGRPAAQTTAELTAAFPDCADLIAAYVPRWLETISGPVPGMIELVDELAGAHIPLYAITNFSGEFWPRFKQTAPVFDHFIDIIVSGDERLTKPDPAIYALALARFGLVAKDALFIDDRTENIDAAQKAGMTGHLFTDAATLRAHLQQLGFTKQSA